MGNCFSNERASAIGGTASNRNAGGNDAVDFFLKSHGYTTLSSQIELSLSASNLLDRDVLSKSDPMAVIYMKRQDGTVEELGRTEVILNSLNPIWVTKHTITYHFEFVQSLIFQVYDVDTHFHDVEVKLLKLEEQQFLGEATCTLSEIVTKSSRSLTINLVQKEEVSSLDPSLFCGEITVHAEEWFSSKTTMELMFRCSDLENKDLISRTDPFLVISKTLESGVSIPICKTEVLKNDLEPKWKPVFLTMQQVGSKDSPLDVECYNFNSSGKHDLIGKVHKSLVELEKMCSSMQGDNLLLPSTDGRSHPKKGIRSQLFVDKFSESVRHTFLDYLAAGCELNFMVAIDYTG